MKIVCDNKVPYIRETLEKIADEVLMLPGADINRESLMDADALIVRTRTHCNAELLDGTSVRFVGTATIGYDHIDTKYMADRGLFWTNCPGCNANAVNQYVRESLNLLVKAGKVSPESEHNKVAIIGLGHVGSRVRRTVLDMGFRTFVYDPILFPERMFDEVYNCDIITFHPPLTTEGKYPTYHMADTGFFDRLTKKPVIINAARGGVIDTEALIRAKDEGKVSELVIDTWENEPDISLELMRRCFIATPHIAGYSANGKVNADNMIVRALCGFFQRPMPEEILPPEIDYPGYNPMDDQNKLVNNPELFEELRGSYPIRLE